MTTLSIQPAYGRNYVASDDAINSWKAGADFKIVGGPYLSIRDAEKLKEDGYDRIYLHFNKEFSYRIIYL